MVPIGIGQPGAFGSLLPFAERKSAGNPDIVPIEPSSPESGAGFVSPVPAALPVEISTKLEPAFGCVPVP